MGVAAPWTKGNEPEKPVALWRSAGSRADSTRTAGVACCIGSCGWPLGTRFTADMAPSLPLPNQLLHDGSAEVCHTSRRPCSERTKPLRVHLPVLRAKALGHSHPKRTFTRDPQEPSGLMVGALRPACQEHVSQRRWAGHEANTAPYASVPESTRCSVLTACHVGAGRHGPRGPRGRGVASRTDSSLRAPHGASATHASDNQAHQTPFLCGGCAWLEGEETHARLKAAAFQVHPAGSFGCAHPSDPVGPPHRRGIEPRRHRSNDGRDS
eukprot:scaffold1068_cov375-Prasinococcus_capsulatus_cf.AAC.30